MSPLEPQPEPVRPWGIVLRGAFLACSWTWCIGMFFPVYMIGDFGVWGWVAFAIPNVLGAGAMGWVLRRPGASERITSRHLTAARAFSIVTVLFHVFFGSWFFEAMLAPAFGQKHLAGPAASVAVLVGGSLLAALGSQGWWRAAAVTWLASAACALAALLAGDSLQWPENTPRDRPWQLACALPVLAFGFALCPYLDLTFHRVRRETPGRAGVAAFWVGFVGLFLPMIVLTLFYAGGLLNGASLRLTIVAHVFVQSTFTVGAHLRELFHFGVIRSRQPYGARAPSAGHRVLALESAAAIALVGACLGGVALTYLPGAPDVSSMRRLGYELFMSFYALVFPAYVWIVVLDRGLSRATNLVTYAAAIVLASPCLWLGYIEHRSLWLLPAAAIPLLAPAVVKRMNTLRGATP